MKCWIVFVVSLLGLSFSRSRNCQDDFAFPSGPLQDYSYKIPHGNEPGYWTRFEEDAVGIVRRIAFGRSFYIFGKFGENSEDGEDTTITAGLYQGEELIYKTTINCSNASWENRIQNEKGDEEKILHGSLKKECKQGDDFDLILKNDNFRLANWIFNAQPLQHKVRVFDRLTNKVQNGTKAYKEGVLRPAVKIHSKPGIYNATHFRFEATGGAFFSRLAFGPCSAWPDNMDSQCQQVREWLHSRSKGNITDESLAALKKLGHPDANFTRGLGVFGNNNQVFHPKCLSLKYFDWVQETLHPDNEIQLYIGDQQNKQRAYCCCTDMRSGQVFENNPARNCRLLSDCLSISRFHCNHAFNATIGKEIFEEIDEENI